MFLYRIESFRNMPLEKLLKTINKYPPEVQSLILIDEQGFSINWEKYTEFKRKEGFVNSAIGLLVDLRVLSLTSTWNYGLIGYGINLNPMTPACTAYFIHQEDALKFKEAEYSQVLFPVKIVHYLG